MLTTYRIGPVTRPRRSAGGSVSLVFSLESGVRALALREDQSLVVGRAEPSHVVIDDRSLSRIHARFWLQEGQLFVEDLGSTNGTEVDGQKVTRAELSGSCLVRLGMVDVNVTGLRSEPDASATQANLGQKIEDELKRARFFGRTFAVAAFHHPLAALPSDFAQLLRPIDSTEIYAPQITLALLPEAGRGDIEELAQRVHGRMPDACGIGVALYPGSAGSGQELLALSIHAARSATPGELCKFSGADPVSPAEVLAPQSPRMHRLHELLARAATTTIPVLILGETGSGKESAARAVHEQSARKGCPYHTINCATLPTSLLAATLFGHERGAFTGADRRGIGLFEQADGGTIFLDEIAELSLEAQAALLRVFECQRFFRVGGTKEVQVDVRVVAATHRDLWEMVDCGDFRQDLLYRIDAFTVRVPPLRERREEIIPLAEHFLGESRSKWGTSAASLSPHVQQLLVNYHWPGNVRQLRNMIERAATVCTERVVELDHLPDALFEAVAGHRALPRLATDRHNSTRSNQDLNERVRQFEAEQIQNALRRAKGNQSEAARLLGVPRRTLANKAHAYGLVEQSTTRTADREEE